MLFSFKKLIGDILLLITLTFVITSCSLLYQGESKIKFKNNKGIFSFYSEEQLSSKNFWTFCDTISDKTLEATLFVTLKIQINRINQDINDLSKQYTKKLWGKLQGNTISLSKQEDYIFDYEFFIKKNTENIDNEIKKITDEFYQKISKKYKHRNIKNIVLNVIYDDPVINASQEIIKGIMQEQKGNKCNKVCLNSISDIDKTVEDLVNKNLQK